MSYVTGVNSPRTHIDVLISSMIKKIIVYANNYDNIISKSFSEYTFVSKSKAIKPLNRNGRGRFGAVKSDSTHHFLEMPVPSQGHCGFPSFPTVD